MSVFDSITNEIVRSTQSVCALYNVRHFSIVVRSSAPAKASNGPEGSLWESVEEVRAKIVFPA